MGRPVVHHCTPELIDNIMTYVFQDYGFEKISKIDGMPCTNVLYRFYWENVEFREKILLARPTQAFAIEQKLQSIEEKILNGEIPPDVARVYIGLQQWRAARKDPKVYGDKMTVSGDAENPIMLLATRLDDAVKRVRQSNMIDVSPITKDDFSDLC